jgi:hypothetical protein
MDHLTLQYGMELGIYNKKTNGYLRCEEDGRKIKCDGIHPFLKVAQSNQV